MAQLTTIVMIVFLLAMALMSVIKIANHIPKTGRCSHASGKKIQAVITNTNRAAERSATMKLVDENGKKYRVKMKADESKMWIKGDNVEILLSDSDKEYRVLFNDYFRENESRIREYMGEKIKKSIKYWGISSRFAGYTEKSSEAFLNSGADARIMFLFYTYMRMVNTYSIIAFLSTVVFLGWRGVYSPKISQQAFPFVVIIIVYFMIYSAVMTCKNILKKHSS